MKKIVALASFSENFTMNVAYFSKACALNYFSMDDFNTVTFVTFLLSLNANNLINFVSIYKCETVMAFHAQICKKKKSSKLSKYSK